jgi:hypothetical protein
MLAALDKHVEWPTAETNMLTQSWEQGTRSAQAHEAVGGIPVSRRS